MLFAIDLSEVYEPADFHRKLSEAMPLPDYYGNNLDALYDVLSGIGESCVMQFQHMEQMEGRLPEYVGKIKRVFFDLMSENENIKVEWE